MAEPPPSRRRWFQFSLASLLWLMLVIALSIVSLREHDQRRRLEAEIARLNYAMAEQAKDLEDPNYLDMKLRVELLKKGRSTKGTILGPEYRQVSPPPIAPTGSASPE